MGKILFYKLYILLLQVWRIKMLKTREELVTLLTKTFVEVSINKKKSREIIESIEEKYNLPLSLISDILTLRVNAETFSDFILFTFLDILHNDKLTEYYTESEINTYKLYRYTETKIKFPLKFKMIEISSEQWIGKISVKQLMQLRDCQLINYNINAQRTMRKIIRRNLEFYQIYLNKPVL